MAESLPRQRRLCSAPLLSLSLSLSTFFTLFLFSHASLSLSLLPCPFALFFLRLFALPALADFSPLFSYAPALETVFSSLPLISYSLYAPLSRCCRRDRYCYFLYHPSFIYRLCLLYKAQSSRGNSYFKNKMTKCLIMHYASSIALDFSSTPLRNLILSASILMFQIIYFNNSWKCRWSRFFVWKQSEWRNSAIMATTI